MLKVLFVASEAAPFAKIGGLGDVTSSLPKELRRQGIDARVIIPKYDSMPEEWKAKLSPQAVFQVSLSWRQHYCGIENLDFDGVPFYFVDNEYYFKRSGLYGHYDDAERFSFFCRAVLITKANCCASSSSIFLYRQACRALSVNIGCTIAHCLSCLTK